MAQRMSHASDIRQTLEIYSMDPEYSGMPQTPYESGNEGCNATPNLITFSWDN